MAILVFEHSDVTGSERLGETLRNHGHVLRVVSLHLGDAVPYDLDDVDGVVCCGGAGSALDDGQSWLEPQMDLLREAHERQMPIVGICLGSQILARALGGEVERLDERVQFFVGTRAVARGEVGGTAIEEGDLITIVPRVAGGAAATPGPAGAGAPPARDE